MAMASATARTDQPGQGRAAVRGRLLRLSLFAPGLVMAASLVGLTLYCHGLLDEAAAGRQPQVGGFGFWAGVVGFLVACVGAIAWQCVHLAIRVAGPEYRLRHAMQRIRTRDVGFRVSLRRGDLLTGLARECNELLDWLNENPPAGVRTGGDVVDVEAVDEERSRS